MESHALRAAGRAAGARHPDRPVRDAEPRHRADRTTVRSGHGDLVSGARGLRHGLDRARAANPGRGESVVCDHAVRARTLDRLRVARLRGAGGDRLRGALCRHGPFRPQAHPGGLVLLRAAGPAAQLFRPGRGAAASSPSRLGRLLFRRSALGASADGAALHHRRRHRIPGGDLRRVLDDAAGGAARPAAAHGDPPHHRPPNTARSMCRA